MTPDPLASYRSDWRKGPTQDDDPLSDYAEGWREKKPGLLSTVADVGEQMLSATADFSLRNLKGLANLAGGIARGAQTINPALRAAGTDVVAAGAERAAGALQRQREEVARYAPADTKAGVATNVLTNVGEEGLSYIVGGGAARRALGWIAKAAPKTPTFAGRIAAGLKEAGKDAAAVLPVDIATAAVGPENSTAGAAAHVTREKYPRFSAVAERIAENPVTRAASESLVGLGADAALRAAAAGARVGGEIVRSSVDLTPELNVGLQAGVRDAATEMQGAAEIARMPYATPDPLSQRGAALRRATSLRNAAEAEAVGKAGMLPSSPAPETVPTIGGALPTPAAVAPSARSLPEPTLTFPVVIGGRGQRKARASLADEADVREFMASGNGNLRSRPVQDVSTWLTAVEERTSGKAVALPHPTGAPELGQMTSAADAPTVLPGPQPKSIQVDRRARARSPLGDMDALRRALPAAEADPSTRVVQLRAIGDVDHVIRSLKAAAADASAPSRPFHIGGEDYVMLVPADRATALVARAQEAGIAAAVGSTLREADEAARSMGLSAARSRAVGRRASSQSDPISSLIDSQLPAPGDPGLGRRAGAASPAVVRGIARTALGAAAGAVLDDEKPLRGAAIGAGALNAPSLLRRARRARRPAPARSSQAVSAVLASVSRPKHETLGARLAARGPEFKTLPRDLYRRLVDETQPLRDFGRRFGDSDALSSRVSASKGWRGGAQRRVASDFRSVLKVAAGVEDQVAALTVAERALELARNGLAEKGVDLGAAAAAVAELRAVPAVAAAADRLRDYYRSLLQYKLANGVLTPERFTKIVESGEFYVPFVRDMDNATRPPTAGGGKQINRGTGVRRMGDGQATGKIVDPFEQAILDTFEAHRTVAKQRVTDLVASIVESAPDATAGTIRRLKGDMAAVKGREVVANVAGKQQRYEVLDPDLYDAWAAFDTHTANVFVRVLAPFKRTLQATVTLMPDFMVRNAVRDNTQSAIQYPFPLASSTGGAALGAAAGALLDEENRLRGATRWAALGIGGGGMAPQLVRMGRALGDIAGKGDIYDEWLREGGSGFSEFYARPSDARKLLRQMRGDRSLWGTIRLPVDALQGLGRMVEEAPRLARYKQLKATGANIPEAIAGSRDISLDFANIGSDTKAYAQVTAFFNAKVQGWDKLARLLKQPKTWAAAAATLTAPSVALWSINKEDPEYWDRPQWERNLFWLVPRPEGGFFRVPKPFEVGMLFASLPERVLDYAYSRDPETLKYALGEMLKTSTEGALPIPTGLEPLLENAVNHDFFTDRPVVGPGLEKLPDEMQYDDRTSALSRLAASLPLFPDSPEKTENILRGWTGNVGREVLAQGDKALRSAGVDDRPLQVDGATAFTGSFVTRDDQMSDRELAVRRRYSDAQSAYLGARRLLEQGDTVAAERFIDEHASVLENYESLKRAVSLLDAAAQARREVRMAAGVSPESKRAILAEVDRIAAGEGWSQR